MSQVFRFAIEDSSGNPVSAQGMLRYFGNGANGRGLEQTAEGQLRFEVPDDAVPLMLAVVPNEVGYWLKTIIAPKPGTRVVCEQLPPIERVSWWHRLLNVADSDQEAGAGIVVGVVDSYFAARQHGLEHAKVRALGAGSFNAAPTGLPEHGEMVARIIGQQPEQGGRCEGLAPGSDLVCFGAEAESGLNPAEVATAIVRLARDDKADLINLSAGRFDNKLVGIRSAIKEAAAMGALCIVAAGNEPRPVAFPACYPECVGVGAIGLMKWGPSTSDVGQMREAAENKGGCVGALPNGEAVYHYVLSAYGEGIDVVAPGVGILVNRGKEALVTATGTSFAAPMVCGLLARLLSRDGEYKEMPRDSKRSAYARAKLIAQCVPLGLDPEREGSGMPRL